MTYQFYDICVNNFEGGAYYAMGGTQDNGIPGRSGTDTWFHSTFVADGMVCNINPNNAQRVARAELARSERPGARLEAQAEPSISLPTKNRERAAA